MKTISVFNHVSVDGFFAGSQGEIDWFKAIRPDAEWEAYSRRQAQMDGATLLFGRITYEMMREWWPTPAAMQADPAMAEVVNSSPKIVFSSTLAGVEEGPNWHHVRLLRDIRPEEMLRLKQTESMVILGSGTLVRQLANLGLIDEYLLVVVPIVLGRGKPLFQGVRLTDLALAEARYFDNGIVLLRYRPVNTSGG